MDRGAWEATVHGVQKAEHDLVTTYTLPRLKKISFIKIIKLIKANVYWTTSEASPLDNPSPLAKIFISGMCL